MYGVFIYKTISNMVPIYFMTSIIKYFIEKNYTRQR